QSMLKDLIDIIVEHIDIRQVRIIVITKSGRIAVRCDLTVKSREYFKIQPLKAAVLVNEIVGQNGIFPGKLLRLILDQRTEHRLIVHTMPVNNDISLIRLT